MYCEMHAVWMGVVFVGDMVGEGDLNLTKS